jgi:hypothetical protein
MPDSRLLATYEPVVQFDPAESLFPRACSRSSPMRRSNDSTAFGWDLADPDPGPGSLPGVGSARPSVGRRTCHARADMHDGDQAWVEFPGFWGELQYFHGPGAIGTVAFGTSPVGPAYHAVWSDPLGTLATWPLG